MRVVHISKVAGIAGSERHLLTLLPALRLRGVDARMIVLEEDGRAAASFSDRLAASGVHVERLTLGHDVDLGITARLGERLAALEPDIVHTHLLHADLYGLRAAHALGIKAIVSSRHNTDRFRRNPIIRWMNRRAMRHASRIIGISSAVSRFVVAVEGCDASRVVTIPYGFDATRHSAWSRERARARFGFTDRDVVIGVVARLTRQKGIDVLVDAFAQISPLHPDAKLLIIGDGPDRALLAAQVEAAGLRRSTTFGGWIDDAWALMGAADVVAVPSRWEGFCLSAVEAMAAARPVVASDVDALSELVTDGETGLLVPPADADALAAALTSLVRNPGLAARLGEQALARATHAFPVEAMVASTLDVYTGVLATAPATATQLADAPARALQGQ